MNKRQKEVAQVQLDAEEKTIRELKAVYKKASEDCEKKIQELSARKDLENIQSIVYQQKYQEAMKKQLDGILDDMNKNQYKDISGYLKGCYEDGYVGTLYDIQGQGVPIIAPIQQNQVVKAIQTDSKISEGMYARLGEDTKYLKNSIRAELSRGIANGSTWNDMATKIAKGMNSPFKKAYNNAIRIARTEGHRVQCSAALDAQNEAKAKGADIVKQWDSTLDGRTRPTHRKLDGQIREVDEEFEVDGMTAMAPSQFGDPSEDCNCRCALLQRARWNLDDGFTKHDGFTDELRNFNSPEDYDEFKKWYFSDENVQYMAYVEKLEDKYGTKKFDVLLDSMTDREYEKFHELESNSPMWKDKNDSQQVPEDEFEQFLANYKFEPTSSDDGYLPFALKESEDEHANAVLNQLDAAKIYYNPVKSSEKEKTNEEIINELCGGDRTRGSCASVGLAYIGQEQGWDVLDFRDGESRFFFSRSGNLWSMSKIEGISALHYGDVAGKSSCTLANNFLKTCEEGKEYYLCVGRHASIVRLNEGKYQYLELQSATNSGWTNFNGNPRYTLDKRFGCSSSSGHGEKYDFMINITDSNFDTLEFRSIIGYLNTDEDGQKKGSSGTIK